MKLHLYSFQPIWRMDWCLKRKIKKHRFCNRQFKQSKIASRCWNICNDWSFWVIIIEGIFENFCKNLFLEPEMVIFLPIMSIFLKHNIFSVQGVLTEELFGVIKTSNGQIHTIKFKSHFQRVKNMNYWRRNPAFCLLRQRMEVRFKIESQMTKSRQYTWTCSSFECRTFCWKTKYKKRFYWKTIFH